MTYQEILAIATRCETEDPNPYLASAILVAAGHQTLFRGEKLGWEWRKDGVGIWSSMPRPDLSLDAAVTLEPKDALEVCVRKYPNGAIYVRLTMPSGDPIYCENFEAKRVITEPMARLAIYLRARAAMEKGDAR